MMLSLVDLLAMVAPPVHSRLAEALGVMPGVLFGATVVATAGAGVMLWFIALGLSRRKERAWILAVLLVGVSLIMRLVAFEHLRVRALLPLGVSALLLLLLLAFRREFYVPTASLSHRGLVGGLIGLVSASCVAGFVLVGTHPGAGGSSSTTGAKLEEVALGLLGIPSAADEGNSRADDLLYYTLLGFGIALGAMILYLLLRSLRRDPDHDYLGHERLRELIVAAPEDSDSDSLAYFATREDRHTMWATDRRSALSYTVVNGVMLAVGDPLGNTQDWPTVMREFVARARNFAWIPAVAACSAKARLVWSETVHMQSLEMGDEAVIDCANFTLHGRERKSVRNAVHRVERAGVAMHLAPAAEIESALRSELQYLMSVWRRGRVERGYSMALGRFADDLDPTVMIAWAEIRGSVQGILQFVPWGDSGLSLDVMRRAPDAPSGLTEALIAHAIEESASMGIERLSLNFAPFRSVLEQGNGRGTGLANRTVRPLILLLSRWYQISSLYSFNKKFVPIWTPRYLAFPSHRDLAKVATAFLRAESFLPRLRDFGPKIATGPQSRVWVFRLSRRFSSTTWFQVRPSCRAMRSRPTVRS